MRDQKHVHRPSVSVCMATFNGGKYIEEQLRSILPQLSPDDEVIISDDMSTDDTLAKIALFHDARIKVFHHKPEKAKFLIDRPAHNFENALRHAKGDIIFLSDQDDKWTENKVAVMLNELETYSLAVSDCYVTDDNLNVIVSSYFSIRRKTNGIWDTLWKSPFLGSCMAFHREVLGKALPFPKYGVGHDLWLALTAFRWFNVAYIDQPLNYYRRHAGTVTVSGERNSTSLFFKIKYRLYVLKSIILSFAKR